jgi:hypothetical protein
MDIGVARFHRLGLITLALIGASCHPSPTLGTQTKKIKKWFYKQLLLKLPQPKKQIRNQTERGIGSLFIKRFQSHYIFGRRGKIFLVLKPKYKLQVAIALPSFNP